jgi:hypothetical protein
MCAATSHPQHSVDEAFAVGGFADVEVGTRFEESEDFLPLLRSEFCVGHELVLNIRKLMSTQPSGSSAIR